MLFEPKFEKNSSLRSRNQFFITRIDFLSSFVPPFMRFHRYVNYNLKTTSLNLTPNHSFKNNMSFIATNKWPCIACNG